MPNITSAASGLSTATSTWVGGVVPVVGDKVTIATGHVVEVTATHTWGDDTSTGITINGTLKASRSATTQLTCRGDLFIAAGGTLDYGTETNPIPAAYLAEIIVNDSATQAHNKWGIRTDETANWTGIRFWGASKTGDTTLSTNALSTDTVLNVTDTTGWAVGDWLSFGPNVAGGAITTKAITAVTASTATIGVSLAAARLSGTKIINLTRNVRVSGKNDNTYGSQIAIRVGTNHTTTDCVELGPFEFRLAGGGSPTWQQAGLAINYASVTTTTNIVKKIAGVIGHSVGSVSGSAVVAVAGGSNSKGNFMFFGNQAAKLTVDSLYSVAHTNSNIFLWAGATVVFASVKMLSASTPLNTGYSQGPVDCNINGGWIVGANSGLISGSGISLSLEGVEIDGMVRLLRSATAYGAINMTKCTIGSLLGFSNPTQFYYPDAGYLAPTVLTDCVMSDLLWVDMAAASYKSQHPANYLKIINRNKNPQKQEKYVRGGRILRANSMAKHSQYGMLFDCLNASTAIVETTMVPIAAGATIALKGFVLLYRSTVAPFGTTAPPSITVSGMGITPQTFVCPEVEMEWQPYTFTVTNPKTYSGNLTITFSAQATAAIANVQCLFDGLLIAPYCTDARHYGYKFEAATAAQTVDPVTVLSESAANALTGLAINFATNTVTVSVSVTLSQLYDWLHAQLVATANLAEPELLTSVDGVNFTCGYNLVIDGGAITGAGALAMPGNVLTALNGGASAVPITHNAGILTTITVTGLVIGSRVQLYDVTTGTELYNAIVTASNLTLSQNWTANHTIRLRATYCVGLAAKMPVLMTAILTGSGANFLVAQQDEPIYIANAIDGSAVTEFTANFSTVLVEVNDTDGMTSVQRMYAWYMYQLTMPAGIVGYFGAALAEDAANYRVISSLINLKIKNMLSTPAIITGARMYRDDGASIFAIGVGPIQLEPGKAYLTNIAKLDDVHARMGLDAARPLITEADKIRFGSTVMTLADSNGTITVTRQP